MVSGTDQTQLEFIFVLCCGFGNNPYIRAVLNTVMNMSTERYEFSFSKSCDDPTSAKVELHYRETPTVVIEGEPGCLLSKLTAADAVDYYDIGDLVRSMVEKHGVTDLLNEMREEDVLEYANNAMKGGTND